MLPVVGGLIAICIFFELERSTFLHAGNLVNLFEQASLFVMFGAAEMFALLLSEIDLSIGYGAGVGAFVIAELIAHPVELPVVARDPRRPRRDGRDRAASRAR